jgi:hypothetical protein
MRNFLFPLIALACPLMMIFMMKGMMGGMHGSGHGRGGADEHQPERITAPGERDPRDERLDELEREVAQLRASRQDADPSRR